MRIVTKKQWRDYIIQKELLYKENHRLNQLLNGDNICGTYCEHCEYGLKNKENLPTMQYTTPNYTCTKNIRCKVFKKRSDT